MSAPLEPIAWLCRYNGGKWIPTVHRSTVEARKRYGGWEFRPLYEGPAKLTIESFSDNVKGAALASAAVEALKPFAERLTSWEAAHPQRGPYAPRDAHRIDVRLGDLRRAAEILKLAEPEKT